jgi:hypothetical protein
MSMTATARHTGTGFEHEIDVNGRHTHVECALSYE